FILIQMPSLEGLKKAYGLDFELAMLQSIKRISTSRMGKHTLVWLNNKVGIQMHEPLEISALKDEVRELAAQLGKGLSLSIKDLNIQVNWVNQPLIGVVGSCTELNASERIEKANLALKTISGLDRNLQAPLNIAFYHAPDGQNEIQASHWRRERALRSALQGQELGLQFWPVRDALTDALAGFRAEFKTLVKYDRTEIRLTHHDILTLSTRIGAEHEANLILLKSALNQCRIWQLLVPGNDISITIPVHADTLMQNQSIIADLLNTYADVAGKVVIAIEVKEGSMSARHLPALNATVRDLHKASGIRFALTEFGLSSLNLSMAQEVDVHMIYLAEQWPESAMPHT